jgi:hypothetical protein
MGNGHHGFAAPVVFMRANLEVASLRLLKTDRHEIMIASDGEDCTWVSGAVVMVLCGFRKFLYSMEILVHVDFPATVKVRTCNCENTIDYVLAC